jgi:hypothetical protein
VVVPTYRPASILTAAIGLGAELGCPILFLCSGLSRARAVASMLGGAVGAALTLSTAPRHRLLEMRTQRVRSALARPYVDTGHKRNVALLLGRMLGWSKVLFLDDDIVDLTAPQVRRAAGHLAPKGMRIAGWRYSEFPDNSVACHALRSSGVRQDVFVGAGALLVDLRGPLPFFPSVYNEDWLFMHDAAVQGRVGDLKNVGAMRQRRFDPFEDPRRARGEEFGDVLAEGLMALVHEGRSVLTACLPSYWEGVIQDRRDMLAGIEQRLWNRRQAGHPLTVDGHDVRRVLISMAAALETLETVTTRDLAEFTSAWRYDLFRWRARTHRLPRFGHLVEALNWLGISDVYGGFRSRG